MITMAHVGPLPVATPRCHHALPGPGHRDANAGGGDSTPGRSPSRRCRDYAHSRGTLAASRPAKAVLRSRSAAGTNGWNRNRTRPSFPAPRRTEYSVRRGWLVLAQLRSSRAERRLGALIWLAYHVISAPAHHGRPRQVGRHGLHICPGHRVLEMRAHQRERGVARPTLAPMQPLYAFDRAVAGRAVTCQAGS